MPQTLSLHQCPACQSELTIVGLRCDPCDLRLEGRFEKAIPAANEFASLPDEDLHLLRIFVHCEGSIREMESALGVSYPTIKSRLSKLREKLKLSPPDSLTGVKVKPDAPRRLNSIAEVLAALETGEIDHAESLSLIKKLKTGKEPK